jgi:hypothetical protein
MSTFFSVRMVNRSTSERAWAVACSTTKWKRENTSIRTHKLNVIRAIIRQGGQIRYALPHSCDDEGEAHAFETKLIAEIGRHDLKRGPLTNQTTGGEGFVGLSPETMAKKAANLGGVSDDPVANEFFHNIAGKQDSVPIKPLGLRRLEATTVRMVECLMINEGNLQEVSRADDEAVISVSTKSPTDCGNTLMRFEPSAPSDCLYWIRNFSPLKTG